MYRLLRKLTATIAITTLFVMLAAPVLAFLYRCQFAVTETNGTDYDMLPVIGTVDNDWLASNGFMDADALDTRIETLGGTTRPHLVADDKTLTAIAVPGDSQTNLYYSTGNTPLTDMDIIVGDTGIITTTPAVYMFSGGANPTEFEFTCYLDMSQVGEDIMTYNGAANYRLYIKSTTTLALSTGGVDRIITAPAISSGVYKVYLYHLSTTPVANIEIDDVNYGTWAGYPGPGVGNIVWGDATATSVPYWEYITGSFAGGAGSDFDYDPEDIIAVNTLPDLNGADEDGTITWGSNPAGVTVTLGSMISGSQPAIGGAEDIVTPDHMPAVTVSDWFEAPDVTGTLLTNPLRPFVTILSDTTTISELLAWRVLGLAFVLFVTVGTAKTLHGHYFIAGILGGASVGGLVATTIWPMWGLVFAIILIVGGLVAERTPSL